MAFLDETGVTNLTSDIKALADTTYPAISAIINAYSSSSAYSVGDFCIHDGSFYKCNTAIASGGETWNSSHWTQTNVVSEWGTKMVVLSYGHSTWDDFEAAYNANAIVYCKASSNSNPATGSQGRMAFMAFVGFSGSSVSNVEFQYYRSVNSHTYTQQGDQVYIYKLTKNNSGGAWTVTTREAYTKIVVGTGLSYSYSNGNLTLTASGGGSTPTNGSATLYASDWIAAGGGWYRQTVAITGCDHATKIDLGIAVPQDIESLMHDRVQYISTEYVGNAGYVDFLLKGNQPSGDITIHYTLTACDPNSGFTIAGTPIVVPGSGSSSGGNINNNAFTNGDVPTYQWDISGNYDPVSGQAEFDLAFSPATRIDQTVECLLLYIDSGSELAQALAGAALNGQSLEGDVSVRLDGYNGLYITNLASDWYDRDNVSIHVTCS